MVYIMTPEAVEARRACPLPSDYYFSIIAGGYEKFGFDKKILKKSFEESFRLVFKPESQLIRQASQPTTA